MAFDIEVIVEKEILLWHLICICTSKTTLVSSLINLESYAGIKLNELCRLTFSESLLSNVFSYREKYCSYLFNDMKKIIKFGIVIQEELVGWFCRLMSELILKVLRFYLCFSLVPRCSMSSITRRSLQKTCLICLHWRF